MTENNILKDLFSKDDPRNGMTIFLAFLVAIVIYHASVFWLVLQDDIQSQFDLENYTIDFEENSFVYEDSRVVNDEERVTLDFSAPNEMFESHNGFGILFVDISYDETSGEFQDQCDTVSVDLTPTGVSAVWGHENNVLSAMNSDCETMSLVLYVFPNYNGTSLSVAGNDKQFWMNEWMDSSHGQGVFELDVEVSVNNPPLSVLPGGSDSGEEVNVSWNAVFFDAIVE